ncbi:hypothetical protein E2562_008277 [Oryza meyeriana var. granulata]|uniref:Uncharacterized protein n=1 Tax=Oryza meyeriana var. granulata TaxID=110450 RepID=A0A6G1DGS5_9ORYZ|nr:hypothetical protein E2562_008277 [Oryza meyeriana var. granulata]
MGTGGCGSGGPNSAKLQLAATRAVHATEEGDRGAKGRSATDISMHPLCHHHLSGSRSETDTSSLTAAS